VKFFPRVENLTPEEFELLVKAWLESVSSPLEAFTASHLETLQGRDGEYSIDVTARFKAFDGASFLVVIECKKHKNPIKREVVQVLREKQLSLGAQKAMVVATSEFQSGAIEYASNHGIALVQVVEGSVMYIQASSIRHPFQVPDDAENYAGFFYAPNPTGDLICPQPFTAKQNYGIFDYLSSS
jgi:restriction system protein